MRPSSGGNINTKYISRRVTLEDGFDPSDLKKKKSYSQFHKPLGSGIHVYFKVKSDEDPEDFDKKDYVLMSQETPSSVFSLTEGDTKELVFKSPNDRNYIHFFKCNIREV